MEYVLDKGETINQIMSLQEQTNINDPTINTKNVDYSKLRKELRGMGHDSLSNMLEQLQMQKALSEAKQVSSNNISTAQDVASNAVFSGVGGQRRTPIQLG